MCGGVFPCEKAALEISFWMNCISCSLPTCVFVFTIKYFLADTTFEYARPLQTWWETSFPNLILIVLQFLASFLISSVNFWSVCWSNVLSCFGFADNQICVNNQICSSSVLLMSIRTERATTPSWSSKPVRLIFNLSSVFAQSCSAVLYLSFFRITTQPTYRTSSALIDWISFCPRRLRFSLTTTVGRSPNGFLFSFPFSFHVRSDTKRKTFFARPSPSASESVRLQSIFATGHAVIVLFFFVCSISSQSPTRSCASVLIVFPLFIIGFSQFRQLFSQSWVFCWFVQSAGFWLFSDSAVAILCVFLVFKNIFVHPRFSACVHNLFSSCDHFWTWLVFSCRRLCRRFFGVKFGFQLNCQFGIWSVRDCLRALICFLPSFSFTNSSSVQLNFDFGSS